MHQRMSLIRVISTEEYDYECLISCFRYFKVEFEVYLIERFSFNVLYIFITVTMNCKVIDYIGYTQTVGRYRDKHVDFTNIIIKLEHL